MKGGMGDPKRTEPILIIFLLLPGDLSRCRSEESVAKGGRVTAPRKGRWCVDDRVVCGRWVCWWWCFTFLYLLAASDLVCLRVISDWLAAPRGQGHSNNDFDHRIISKRLKTGKPSFEQVVALSLGIQNVLRCCEYSPVFLVMGRRGGEVRKFLWWRTKKERHYAKLDKFTPILL